MEAIMNSPNVREGMSYELYRKELLAWSEVTDINRNNQGIMVALSLPETDDMPVREKLFNEISVADLKSDDGLSTLLEFLDQNLGKDDLTDSFDKFEDFNKFQRKQRMSLQEYISAFDTIYKKIEKKGVTFPFEILAFQLVEKSNVTRKERLIIFTGVNFKNRARVYEDVKRSLNIVKGDSILSSGSRSEQERAFMGVDKENFDDKYIKTKKQWTSEFWKSNGRIKAWMVQKRT